MKKKKGIFTIKIQRDSKGRFKKVTGFSKKMRVARTCASGRFAKRKGVKGKCRRG